MSTTNVSSTSALPGSQPPVWEEAIANLLAELSSVQSELLGVLKKKRQLIAQRDQEQLAAMQAEEESLASRLSDCQQRRQSLLEQASGEGLPDQDLKALSEALPTASRERLRPAIREGRNRARLLQHESLANWVLVQRSLLHLSQMIEIIATGGQKAPTYQKSGPATSAGGALVDCDV